MVKKFISAVIALTMVMGMCSCSDSSSVNETTKNSAAAQSAEQFKLGDDIVSPTADYKFVAASDDASSDEKFLMGANDFSVELFRKSVEKDIVNGKNTLVSPESVLFALGMTENGAKGETLRQLQKVLCKDLDTDTFNKNMNKLISCASSSSDFKFSIANSVWVKDMDKMTLNEQFTKNCKELYNADLFKAPFNDETKKQMNNWVNEKTNSMIPSIIDELGVDTAAVLLNAIAFEADWEEKFDPEGTDNKSGFTLNSGKTVDSTSMTSMEKLYVSDENAQGFIKNYKGEKYAFMAVLPNEDTDIANYVASMSDDEIAALYSGRTDRYDVIAKLPQFKFDYGAELVDTLSDMGIKDAFSVNADFSKLFNNTSSAINRVIHKTHIELDAKGTKAAAATAVTMTENAMAVTEEPKSVILDRPFVFAIMDTETGLPVFLGTVCDPSAE